jgi:hypothetical protein
MKMSSPVKFILRPTPGGTVVVFKPNGDAVGFTHDDLRSLAKKGHGRDADESNSNNNRALFDKHARDLINICGGITDSVSLAYFEARLGQLIDEARGFKL